MKSCPRVPSSPPSPKPGMLSDLSRSPELIALLERVLGGEIFAWKGQRRTLADRTRPHGQPRRFHRRPEVLLQHTPSPGLLLLPTRTILYCLDPAHAHRRNHRRSDPAAGRSSGRPARDLVEGERVPRYGRNPTHLTGMGRIGCGSRSRDNPDPRRQTRRSPGSDPTSRSATS